MTTRTFHISPPITPSFECSKHGHTHLLNGLEHLLVFPRLCDGRGAASKAAGKTETRFKVRLCFTGNAAV